MRVESIEGWRVRADLPRGQRELTDEWRGDGWSGRRRQPEPFVDSLRGTRSDPHLTERVGVYKLEIKASAVASNQAVGRLVENEGTSHQFDAKEEAEGFARRLSEEGARVRVQKVAPQDAAAVDGYLVPHPRRYHREPKESEKAGLTFDVGANLYGEVGRAVVFGTYGVSPAVRYYFDNHVDGVHRRSHRIDVVPEPDLPDELDARVSWSPDCLFSLYRRADDELERTYYCEIKTGQASFQRGQLEDMVEVSKRYDVLKIRVDVEGLPEEYTVRIDPIT